MCVISDGCIIDIIYAAHTIGITILLAPNTKG